MKMTKTVQCPGCEEGVKVEIELEPEVFRAGYEAALREVREWVDYEELGAMGSFERSTDDYDCGEANAFTRTRDKFDALLRRGPKKGGGK